MSFWDIVESIFEIGLVVFTVWAVFHEDRFVAFEEKIAAHFRRKSFKVVGGGCGRARISSAKKTY